MGNKLLLQAISCFSCGLPMYMEDEVTGYCGGCHVREEHRDYVSHLRLASGRWWGWNISYLDHGKQSYPSPA